MIGKSMFMAKKGESVNADEIKELVGSKEKLPPCRGYDRDEQCDDWNGFPRTEHD